MAKIPFISQAYTGRSTNFESSRSINLFPEVATDINNAKSVAGLFGTAGTTLWASIGTTAIRGMHVFNNTLYVVSGSSLYGITLSYTGPVTSTILGTLASTSGRVQMADNGVSASGVGGNQLIIVDGLNGYLYNINTQIFQQLLAVAAIQATATLYLDALMITNGGAGYTQVPNATAAGPNGSAVLSVTLTNGSTTGLAFQNAIQGSFNYGTPTVVTIDAPSGSYFPANAQSVAFIDGYFVVTTTSMSHYCSNLYNGMSWNPLATGVVSATTDNIQGVVSAHQQLWFIKQNSTEVWYDTGTFTGTASPFARLAGGVVDFGTPAPNSITTADNSVFFLANQRTAGGAVFIGAVECNGYTPTVISPAAITYQMSKWNDLANAFAFSYSDGGHTFAVFTSPGDNQTFVYDTTTSFWHEWSSYTAAPYVVGRHLANCYARFNGLHLVGDFASGNIYQLSFSTYTDNGNPIVSQRISPVVADKEDEERLFIQKVMIDAEGGVGAQDTTPLVSLAWSNDGGHKWTNEHVATIGAIGAYWTRLFWRRLGYGRNRVFRLTLTAPTKKVIMDAYVEAGL